VASARRNADGVDCMGTVEREDSREFQVVRQRLPGNRLAVLKNQQVW
jgi:hypothetical protein